MDRPDDDRPEDERADGLRDDPEEDDRADGLGERDDDRLEAAEEREPLDREELAWGGGEGARGRLDRGSIRGGGVDRGLLGSTRRGSIRRSVEGALRGRIVSLRPERADGSTERKGVEPGVFDRTPSITRRGTE